MQGLRCSFLFLVLTTGATAQWNPLNPVAGVQQQADGALFQLQSGAMKVQVCTDSVIRLLYSPTSQFPDRPDYVVTNTTWPAVQWRMQSTDKDVSLVTGRLKVTVNRADGVIVYSDLNGKRLMQEGPRTMTPTGRRLIGLKLRSPSTLPGRPSMDLASSRLAFGTTVANQ